MANYGRNVAKERFWRHAFRRYENSGMTIREFCRREGLKESSFYFWNRELKRRSSESPEMRRNRHGKARPRRNNRRLPSNHTRVSHPSLNTSPGKVELVPVTVPHLAVSPIGAEIVLSAACVVRVARGCDAETLNTVLRALEARAC